MKQLVNALFILLLIVVMLGIIKGAGPTIGEDGWLKWDYTGLIAREENATERERIRQREATERNEDNVQAFQVVAVAAAAAAVIVVWTVQHNRTQRKAIEVMATQAPQRQLPPVANLYISLLIPGGQGDVIDVGGVRMIRDDTQRRLIPLDVAERELATLGLLPPPVARLPGPTIDGA